MPQSSSATSSAASAAKPTAPHSLAAQFPAARPGSRLLAALAPEDLARLRPHLEPVDLPLKALVAEAGGPITHVTFVEGGVASMLADTGDGRYEVGMIGPEGLIGLPAVLGVDHSPHAVLIQSEGAGLRLPVPELRAAMAASPALNALLLRYAYAFLVQVAGTAHANASLGVEARLAR